MEWILEKILKIAVNDFVLCLFIVKNFQSKSFKTNSKIYKNEWNENELVKVHRRVDEKLGFV